MDLTENNMSTLRAVICLNDQGGSMMACSENVAGTLRAQEHGHQPLVLATQQGGAEVGIGVCPTITAAAGMSGNNQPVLFENHGIDARYTGPHTVAPTMSARYALYNATKYVCLWDSTFEAYLAKKRAEGKHYNVALSHAAKKLVRLIYAMEKSRQPYNSVA